LSAASYSKGSIFAVALKNILLAALVNQFSPTSYAQRFCFVAAKIVSPPRGAIMLYNISYAEALPTCTLQAAGLCGKCSVLFAGNRVVRKVQRALCRKRGCAESPAHSQVESAQIANASLFTGV
jgi:hypothetical protein